MLIERGADLSAQNEDKETPLHLALRRRQFEVAHRLIERGVNVATQDKHGWTPLHLVLQEGQLELACMLIERGADVTAETKNGEPPLHQALILPYLMKVSPQKYAEVVRKILDYNPDTTTHAKNGSTPFELALRPRLPEVSPALLQHTSIPASAENMTFGSTPTTEPH